MKDLLSLIVLLAIMGWCSIHVSACPSNSGTIYAVGQTKCLTAN